MPKTAIYWIKQLDLQPHPEGGHFKEVYRSGEFVQKKGLPARYSSFRAFSTSIYFLLRGSEYSAFHRLKSDETWHFYEGTTLLIFIILPDGKMATIGLGRNPDKKEVLQFTIPKGAWFAARTELKNSYSLLGCTVAPGFDFDDFEMGKKENLMRKFPQHKNLIAALSID
ncbi:MAG: cupin domain-containing protein [Bacteroidales bacterium]|nr:cupin domain-containing protein [Bacteroidales bacterium]MCF8404511.1 cupin domain-containing protein [Bacteroidales bacterium]